MRKVVRWTVAATSYVDVDTDEQARELINDYFEARTLNGIPGVAMTMETMTIQTVTDAS